MRQAGLVLLLLVAGNLAIADRAAASTIITFDECPQQSSLCDQLTITLTLAGAAINVHAEGPPGYGLFGAGNRNRALGFNVAGSQEGVLISGLTTGFNFFGENRDIGGGFGFFEYAINGPGTQSAQLPLDFTVSRTSGFTSELSLLEYNDLGYIMAGHLRNNLNGRTSYVGTADRPDIPTTPVPEPATLVLFGSGLLAAAGVRRRR